MTEATTSTCRPTLWIDGRLPQGWRPAPGEGDLTLVGPALTADRAPVVRVTLTPAAGCTLDEVCTEIVADAARLRPDAVHASSDIWPHALWGEGRLVQTASLDGTTAVAYDTYVFLVEGSAVRIDVDCPLVDLLALEEQIAAIVARLRTRLER